MTALATNYASLIAAEGRKFGLYLLTSTQRPTKVHEEVLSQCDNLLLMRMNSEADLGRLRETFSFVPEGLIQRATTFRQGESLVAGKFVPIRRTCALGSGSRRKAVPTYQLHGQPQAHDHADQPSWKAIPSRPQDRSARSHRSLRDDAVISQHEDGVIGIDTVTQASPVSG